MKYAHVIFLALAPLLCLANELEVMVTTVPSDNLKRLSLIRASTGSLLSIRYYFRPSSPQSYIYKIALVCNERVIGWSAYTPFEYRPVRERSLDDKAHNMFRFQPGNEVIPEGVCKIQVQHSPEWVYDDEQELNFNMQNMEELMHDNGIVVAQSGTFNYLHNRPDQRKIINLNGFKILFESDEQNQLTIHTKLGDFETGQSDFVVVTASISLSHRVVVQFRDPNSRCKMHARWNNPFPRVEGARYVMRKGKMVIERAASSFLTSLKQRSKESRFSFRSCFSRDDSLQQN